MQRFFSELQRRKVLRIASGYVVGGWIILQVSLALQTSMSLPAWFSTVIVSLLIIGFPIALVATWFLEITPEGIKRTIASGDGALLKPQTTDFILVGMLALVLVFAFVQAVMPRDSAPSATSATADAPRPKPEPPALGDKSIAVLPFANLSPDKDDEYFADGLTEELLNLLSKIGDLKVISRTSSFAFKGKDTPLPEIAKQLGVRHIVEGSVRSEGENLRVTVQLIDVANDTNLWSETYERKIENIFALQDEIARAVAAALSIEVTLSSVARNPPTRNLEAYRLYLEGLNLYRRRELAADPQTIDRLQKAVVRDPAFAEAHAVLAVCYLGNINFATPRTTAAKLSTLARASAQAAIDLKPTLGLPYAVMSGLDRREFNWASAESNAERAVALAPSDSVSLLFLGAMQTVIGKFDMAVGSFAEAHRLDPLHDRISTYILGVQIARGNDLAAEQLAEGMAQSPRVNSVEALFANGHLAKLAYDRGDAAKAAFHYKRSLPSQVRDRPFVSAVVKAFRSVEAKGAAVKALQAEAGSSPGFEPFATYLLLRAHDALFSELDARLNAGEKWRANVLGLTVAWGTREKALRNDPRFKGYLQKIGLIDYWKKHGWPDRCRAKGEDDFECS